MKVVVQMKAKTQLRIDLFLGAPGVDPGIVVGTDQTNWQQGRGLVYRAAAMLFGMVVAGTLDIKHWAIGVSVDQERVYLEHCEGVTEAARAQARTALEAVAAEMAKMYSAKVCRMDGVK